MKALCAGRDPEWWSPSHEQARLAMRICSLCTGCPENDPAPHGVIRQGVAYSDTGVVLPLCPSCARPNPDWRGGQAPTRCRLCAEPALPLMNVAGSHGRWLNALSARGMSDKQIGLEAGMHPNSVGRTRRRHARPAPTAA